MRASSAVAYSTGDSFLARISSPASARVRNARSLIGRAPSLVPLDKCAPARQPRADPWAGARRGAPCWRPRARAARGARRSACRGPRRGPARVLSSWLCSRPPAADLFDHNAVVQVGLAAGDAGFEQRRVDGGERQLLAARAGLLEDQVHV